MKTAGALCCLAFFLTAFGTARGDTACQDRPMARGLVPLAYAAEASIQYFGVAGALKGAAFVFDLGTLCIVHLGDLSHRLTPEQLHQIGRVDVALIPINGTYTMGPDTAREVLQQLNPRIAIPMHYRDNLILVEAFVRGLNSRRLHSDTLLLSQALLPASTEIIVLRPQGARE